MSSTLDSLIAYLYEPHLIDDSSDDDDGSVPSHRNLPQQRELPYEQGIAVSRLQILPIQDIDYDHHVLELLALRRTVDEMTARRRDRRRQERMQRQNQQQQQRRLGVTQRQSTLDMYANSALSIAQHGPAVPPIRRRPLSQPRIRMMQRDFQRMHEMEDRIEAEQRRRRRIETRTRRLDHHRTLRQPLEMKLKQAWVTFRANHPDEHVKLGNGTLHLRGKLRGPRLVNWLSFSEADLERNLSVAECGSYDACEEQTYTARRRDQQNYGWETADGQGPFDSLTLFVQAGEFGRANALRAAFEIRKIRVEHAQIEERHDTESNTDTLGTLMTYWIDAIRTCLRPSLVADGDRLEPEAIIVEQQIIREMLDFKAKLRRREERLGKAYDEFKMACRALQLFLTATVPWWSQSSETAMTDVTTQMFEEDDLSKDDRSQLRTQIDQVAVHSSVVQEAKALMTAISWEEGEAGTPNSSISTYDDAEDELGLYAESPIGEHVKLKS